MKNYQKSIFQVTHNNLFLALILKSNFEKDGIEFFTPNEFSQQLGYMKRPKGYEIKPHIHNKISRQVSLTQEVLFIKKGRLKVNFYDSDFRFIKFATLEKGDVILLANGGHGFEILEEAEIIEVKQGPFVGDADKTRF